MFLLIFRLFYSISILKQINFNYKLLKTKYAKQAKFLIILVLNFQEMQSARNILSPTKQNQLPSGRGSPLKNQKGNLNQILQYLKQNGIKLPSNLISNKNPEEFSLKLNPVINTTQNIPQLKSLKIKLSDTEFELKKMEEDFAQYKRSVKLQKEKQQKKFQENLERIKHDSKQNNQDYDFAKEKQIKQHNLQVEKIHNEYVSKLNKLQKELTLNHSHEISKIKHKLASQMQSSEIQANKKYSNLHKQLIQEIQRLKKDFQKEKHNINLRNKQKFDQNKRKMQSNITALESQKKTQQKLHEKTKTQAQRQKQKLFSQLCFQKNVKRNLQDQVCQRNKEIKQLKQKIYTLNIEMQIVKENAIQEKKWMKDENQKQLEHYHDEYEVKIKKILDAHTYACDKYEIKIQKLNYLHDQSAHIMESKLEDLSFKFEERLSKKEDLEEIKKLTDTIVRRDEEIKKLTRDLRYRNLQIQNKEEVYNKIFKSSSRMREEKILAGMNKCDYPMPKLQRDSWSKQSLFRKSQTADIKFILKNMNKSKRQKAASKQE